MPSENDPLTIYFEVGHPPHVFKLKRSDARLIEGLKREIADTSRETIKLPGINSKTFRLVVWYLLDRVVETTETQEAQKLLQLADLWTVSKLLGVESMAPSVLKKWSNDFPSMAGLQFDFLRAASRVYKNETADGTFRSFFRHAASDALAVDDWSSKRLTDYLRAGGPMAEDLYEVEARIADSRAQKLREERRRSVDLEAEVGALREELKKFKEKERPSQNEPGREDRRRDEHRRDERDRDNRHRDDRQRDERDRQGGNRDEPSRHDHGKDGRGRGDEDKHHHHHHGHHHPHRHTLGEYRTTLDKVMDFLKEVL